MCSSSLRPVPVDYGVSSARPGRQAGAVIPAMIVLQALICKSSGPAGSWPRPIKAGRRLVSFQTLPIAARSGRAQSVGVADPLTQGDSSAASCGVNCGPCADHSAGSGRDRLSDPERHLRGSGKGDGRIRALFAMWGGAFHESVRAVGASFRPIRYCSSRGLTEGAVLLTNICLAGISGEYSRGCSSVVERHVANVNVVSSNLITRFPRLWRLQRLRMTRATRVDHSDTYGPPSNASSR